MLNRSYANLKDFLYSNSIKNFAMEKQQVTVLDFEDNEICNRLFGPCNANLEVISKLSQAKLDSRGSKLFIVSSDKDLIDLLSNLFFQLYFLMRSGYMITEQDIIRSYKLLAKNPELKLADLYQQAVFIETPRKKIVARNISQKSYFEALKKNDMVFAVGPAGTGKTYLAVAMALSMLNQHKVKRLVLARPAVEAGERLGFLPGDLAEKVNPYLRPLYDALYDMMPQAKVAALFEANIIEIAPLAFMRGRTLNDSYIILDEAQNTTHEQMKMFLTRMGFGSRMVITGDITQIDLPVLPGEIAPRSGLAQALQVLRGVPGLAIHHFDKYDVVRHPLVGAIVNAYAQAEKDKKPS